MQNEVQTIELNRDNFDSPYQSHTFVKKSADELYPEDTPEPRECPRCNEMFVPNNDKNREHCIGCLEGVKW